jgi:hypothetical protein
VKPFAPPDAMDLSDRARCFLQRASTVAEIGAQLANALAGALHVVVAFWSPLIVRQPP